MHLRAEVWKLICSMQVWSSVCRIFQHFGAKGYDHMLRQDVQFSGRTDFIRANSGKIWKNAFFKELHAYDRHILPFTNESFYSKVLSILQNHCTIFSPLLQFLFWKNSSKLVKNIFFALKKTRNNFCIFCYLCISTDKSIYLTHIQNLSADDISLATHFDWKSDTHILLFLSCYFCKQSFR